jgi:hypothetical protein
MALIFDSLTTARMLQSKGFTAQQAEGIAEQMNQLLIQDLATKGDIDILRSEMKAHASELTVKMYGVGLAVVALVVAAQKLLP